MNLTGRIFSSGEKARMEIKHSWYGKKVKLVDIDDKVFLSFVDAVTGKGDNYERGKR